MAIGKTNFQTPNDPNLIAGNIKNGVSILGVTGTYNPLPGTIQSLVLNAFITIYYYRIGDVIIISYGIEAGTNYGFLANVNDTVSKLLTAFNTALGLSLSNSISAHAITAPYIYTDSGGGNYYSPSINYSAINILY